MYQGDTETGKRDRQRLREERRVGQCVGEETDRRERETETDRKRETLRETDRD